MSQPWPTQRFFGQPWTAPATEGRVFETAPVGHQCAQCAQHIAPGDRGLMLILATSQTRPPEWIAWHLACWLRHLGLDPELMVIHDAASCGHCGRVCRDRAGGSAMVGQVPVCHPNSDGRPDCYRLITVWGHRLLACADCTPPRPPWLQ